MTTNQPDAKSNPNPNPTKQHAIVNTELNIVLRILRTLYMT